MIKHRLFSEEVRNDSEEDGHNVSATEIYYAKLAASASLFLFHEDLCILSWQYLIQ